MKKCIGCGAILQNENSNAIGYVKDLNMNYCERCFKIKHYGNLTIDMKDGFKNIDILKEVSKVDATIVLIIDILNIEFTFTDDLVKSLKGKNVIVVFNKLDLLPKNTNIKKYEDYLISIVKNKLSGINVLDILISSKYDKNFKEFFYDVINRHQNKRYIFMGYYNAGKSTILNKILDEDKVVVSYFPSTTLSFNKFEVEDYEFIDTPGLIYKNHLANYTESKNYKKIVMNSTIKPQVFQLYDKQSYVIDDLVSFSLMPKDKASIVFYINNNFNIHRTKTDNLSNYLSKAKYNNLLNSKELLYNLGGEKVELVINGIGVISFKNIESVVIKMKNDLEIIKRKSVF